MNNEELTNNKICVSLGGGLPLGDYLQLASKYSFVEARLDLMRIDSEKINLLAMQCQKWIATCRPGKLSERERMVLLSAAIHAGAKYIDIEYEATHEYRQPLVELAKRRHCKVIISYHNYDETPDDETLNMIIDRSKGYGADLVKIAVMANSHADCAKVLSLYSRHDNIVAFAMGETGKITRITSLFLGAEFSYASIDKAHQTAPGQLTVSQINSIIQLFNYS